MPVENILEVNNLTVDYRTPKGSLQALRNVELNIPKGSIVGIVGESGCGKSTLIGTLIKLLADNAEIKNGVVNFDGEDLLTLSEPEMRKLRGDRISMIFQDPMTALNPILSIGTQMCDIQNRLGGTRAEKRKRAIDMLAQVGIPDPETRLSQIPNEFSGGMRQRICIAMALMANPDLLIADEPTTALDATLEVQIIHMLQALQANIGCSILFISHHLGVIAELCEEVVVMYAGEVVESGSVEDIFYSPKHPYTSKLLECDPACIDEPTRTLPTIPGEIPNLTDLPKGCIFRSRCDRAIAQCAEERPLMNSIGSSHCVACHLHQVSST